VTLSRDVERFRLADRAGAVVELVVVAVGGGGCERYRIEAFGSN
jgi:hypothetical protein